MAIDKATREQKLRNAGFQELQIPIIDGIDQRVAAKVTETTTATAGASYTVTEEGMLNSLKTDVGAILTALTNAGLMSAT